MWPSVQRVQRWLAECSACTEPVPLARPDQCAESIEEVNATPVRDYFMSGYRVGNAFNARGTGYEPRTLPPVGDVLFHEATGVCIWSRAIDLSPPGSSLQEMKLLFHYTSEVHFCIIAGDSPAPADIWASLHAESYGRIAALMAEPADFDSSQLVSGHVILSGNDEEVAMLKGKNLGFADCTSFCVPVFAPRSACSPCRAQAPGHEPMAYGTRRGGSWTISFDSKARALRHITANEIRRLQEELCALEAEGACRESGSEAPLGKDAFPAGAGHFTQALRTASAVRVATRLAELLMIANRLSDARHLLERALAGCEELFGPGELDTLEAAERLASCYRRIGEINGEVIPRERSMVECCVDTGNGVDRCCDVAGAYNESAEALYRRVFAEASSRCGDPLMAQRARNLAISTRRKLALLLSTRGRPAEAEPLLRQHLDMSISRLGEDHVDTLVAMSSLAAVLEAQGKRSDAEVVLRKAATLHQRLLGPKHPTTLHAKRNLACCLEGQTKFREAEALRRGILQVLEAERGPDHVATLAAAQDLAACVRMREELSEASHVLAEQSPLPRGGAAEVSDLEACAALSQAASCLEEERDYTKAEQYRQQVLTRCRDARGAKHPDTVEAMFRLGNNLVDQQRFTDAEAIFRQMLDKPDEVQCCSAIAASHALAWVRIAMACLLLLCLLAAGKGAEADVLSLSIAQDFEWYIDSAEPLCGRSLSTLVKTVAKVAAAFMDKHRCIDAEHFFRLLLRACEREESDDAVTALFAANELRRCLEEQGKDSTDVRLLLTTTV